MRTEDKFIVVFLTVLAVIFAAGVFIMMGPDFGVPLVIFEVFIALFWAATNWIGGAIGKWAQGLLVIGLIAYPVGLAFTKDIGNSLIQKKVAAATYITIENVTYYLTDAGDFGPSDANGILKPIGRISGNTLIFNGTQYGLYGYLPPLPLLAFQGSKTMSVKLQ